MVVTTASAQFIDQKIGANAQDDENLSKISNANNISGDTPYDVSLTGSSSSGNMTNEDDNYSESDQEPATEIIKCSAIHTLERDMPDFDYSHLVKELRGKILHECEMNPGTYSEEDRDKCRDDDWYLSRFLLRQKLDVNLACEMLKKALRFRYESLVQTIKAEDFPAEFYKVGGLFSYEPDRKGNKMLYIRVKVHKRITEINAVLQGFLYFNIDRLDKEAGGKGAGLASADMDMLLFLISTLVNYFPKGFSYLLVHNLPWLLKPFWYIAKGWVSEEHRELVKFSNSRTIYEYVDRENLPDFMGGICKRDYRAPPENCSTLWEAAKLWGLEERLVKRILSKFADYLPAETLEEINELSDDNDDDSEEHTSEEDRENNKTPK